jgi:hypothetical protein
VDILWITPGSAHKVYYVKLGLGCTEPSGTRGVLDSGIWLALNVPGGWIYLAILYVVVFSPLP